MTVGIGKNLPGQFALPLFSRENYLARKVTARIKRGTRSVSDQSEAEYHSQLGEGANYQSKNHRCPEEQFRKSNAGRGIEKHCGAS